MLGIRITEKLDIPEILMAVNSSVFFILKKNQILPKLSILFKKIEKND